MNGTLVESGGTEILFLDLFKNFMGTLFDA